MYLVKLLNGQAYQVYNEQTKNKHEIDQAQIIVEQRIVCWLVKQRQKIFTLWHIEFEE